LLYFDNNFDIVKADLDGMVVNECSCSWTKRPLVVID
jgi:hypothetical protein